MVGTLLISSKVLAFIGGAAAVVIGKKVIKSEKTRNLCVKGLAQGMKLQDCAKEIFQNIKEEAHDIYVDARAQAAEAGCCCSGEKTQATEDK